jgi:hypothetical protein
MFDVCFLHKATTIYKHYIFEHTTIQSSFSIFSAASCNSLSKTSSTTLLAIFIISKASFITGSASGLYGSDGGESPAAIKNVLVNFEARNEHRGKNLNKRTYNHSTFSSFFSLFCLFSGVVRFFFILFNGFIGHLVAALHPNIRIELPA